MGSLLIQKKVIGCKDSILPLKHFRFNLQKRTTFVNILPSSSAVTLPEGVATVCETRTGQETASRGTR